MAAALLDHHAAGRVVVRSAGSQPADRLNPAVVQAMSEVGLDLGQAFPKPLTTEAVQASDPAGKDIATVRRIRDDIDGRVRALLAELVPPAGSASGFWPDLPG